MNTTSSIRPSHFLLSSVVVAAAALAGCNSQQDDIGNPVVSADSMTPGGIYQGTMTPQAGTTSTPVIVLVDDVKPQQHIVTYSATGSFLSSGLVTPVGGGLTAQLRYFDLTATTPAAAAAQTESISGSFVEQSEIGGQYSRADSTGTTVDSGNLSLAYQIAEYEVPSALTSLAGHWANTDSFGTASTFFDLDASGKVSGQSTATGCTYSGTAGIIDLRYNLYSLSLTQTCTTTNSSDVLTGLATILPASAATNNQKQLVLGVASPSAGQLFRLTMASN